MATSNIRNSSLGSKSRTTLAQLLTDSVTSWPAIIVPHAALTVSYKSLADQVEKLASQFRGAGLSPGDVVAIVLPNSLEFLVVFLGLTRARLIAAPINPADKGDELRHLIAAGKPKAVVAESGNPIVTEAAKALSVPAWDAHADASGVVILPQITSSSMADADSPQIDDVALLMYTSGTTGQPKGVPLTHANVVSSATHIVSHYALTPDDRSLLVMPLFHGHGLIGAALSTLSSGGALIVPPRFSASSFWPLFLEHRATWYTAVPTIHQVLLMRADSDSAPYQGPRFIRSCSAALAPAVLANLEKRFGAPVLEAYGMTETAHQAASNPLPPLARKPGTVGFATGDEIAVIDQAGVQLPANTAGEVVVRGPNVMRGYRENSAANLKAFSADWFRTGDIGMLDADRYLSLTGRIKEMINRGGEKISPEEVEAALLENPAVAEAAVFGVADAKYGEDVWAAVVLKAAADENALKTFCRSRLADFKVPKAIRIVASLPKNAMGKIVRRDLASRFKP